MIFTELILQNFGPYAGSHKIDLRPGTGENAAPIILFGGMNGGGKTTLMDAIRLALYGQRARCSTRGNFSYAEFLTQAVNNQTSPIDSTRIELAFERIVDDRWQQYRIVRYWTRNPKDGKDTLGILVEDWPDTSLASTWDEYIETILPQGISNLFLFDGEQVKELAEQDNPPPGVVEAIQSLLGLELAERLLIDLDILAGRKRKVLAKENQLENLEAIEKRLQRYTADLEAMRGEMETLQKEKEIARENYEVASDRFRVEGGKIASERSELEKRKKGIEGSIDGQRESLQKLASEMLPLVAIVPLLEEARVQGERELQAVSTKVSRSVLEQRDRKLLAYLPNISLTEEQIREIEKFLFQENQSLVEEMNSLAGGAPLATESYYLDMNEETLKQLTAVLEHHLPAQITLLNQILERLKGLENDLDNLDRELAVAASPEEYEELNKNLQSARKTFLDREAAYEQGRKKYEEIKKSIEKTKKELATYSEKALEYHDDEHIVRSIVKAQDTLRLFKERLTLKKLTKLEGEVTECFRYLLHKSDLVHRVAIETRNFSLSLYGPDGQSVPKHRLSAGEKQLLSIAFLWGLARVSGRDLPIAIDTPLGRLDSSHRQNLVERYFPSASHQVILLSTDTEIGQNELNLLKEQGAIAREYLLQYDSSKRQTTVHPDRYFW
ncbi:DNA sulfur modification protein DndD [Pannus brasiliensis CCIBt3594]|uniref:Nuclease SbcCD subunit C n=1 Tax=Pannus brasiliensis CCIBt3594 TaxID=1427578 RepID=A0AAW9QRU4_9CHRO